MGEFELVIGPAEGTHRSELIAVLVIGAQCACGKTWDADLHVVAVPKFDPNDHTFRWEMQWETNQILAAMKRDGWTVEICGDAGHVIGVRCRGCSQARAVVLPMLEAMRAAKADEQREGSDDGRENRDADQGMP